MDAAERIADYLSDDLAPDEREAFEAELARDAALRAQVEAVRRADDALATIAPTGLPEGFEERLRAAVDAELADVLTPAAAEEPDPRVAAQAELGHRDDLAARRATRTVPRWVGGLAGAAAAVLVAVAGVAGLSSMGGGDEGAESATGEAFDAGGEAETSMETEATEEEATAQDGVEEEAEAESAEDAFGQDDAAEEGAALLRAPDQPVLVAEGRSLDDDQLDAVLLTPELSDLAAQQLPAEEGEALAAEFADRWQTAAAPGARDDADRAIREAGAADLDDRAAVAECLASADDAGRREGIAAYAEVADYQGTPVVVLGLVTLDPATQSWSVPEVQVLDRASCDLLAARP